MYQEVCFNRGTEAGGGKLMWATTSRSAPLVIFCLLRACIVKTGFAFTKGQRTDAETL